MCFGRRRLAEVFLWIVMGGLFNPSFAQTPEVPPSNLSQPSARIMSRLGSTRFDVGGPVASAAWSPDGKTLATVVDAKRVAIWNAKTGERVWQKVSTLQASSAVHFSSDGKILIHSGSSGQRAFEAATGEPVDLESDSGAPAEMFLNVQRGKDQRELVWESGQKEKQKITISIEGQRNGFQCFRLSPDGRYLATGSNDGQLSLWDVRNGRRIRDFEIPKENIRKIIPLGTNAVVEFSPDGKLLIAAGYVQGIHVFDVDSGQRRRSLQTDRIHSALAVDPQSKRLATAEQFLPSVKIWNLESGELEREILRPMANVQSISFSPDGNQIVIAGRSSLRSGGLGVWDVASGEKQLEEAGHAGLVTKLTFSPDGRHLATASADRMVCLWEVGTGNQPACFQGNADSDLSFSSDGSMLAAAGPLGSHRIWEVSSFGLLRERGHLVTSTGRPTGRFSPDLDRFGLTSNRGQLHIIETATGKRQPVIQVFDQQEISAVAFSPEGKWLAVGSGWGRPPNRPQVKAVLWDLAQNKPERELADPLMPQDRHYYDNIESLSFSPDGRALAVIHSKQGLHVWDHWQGTRMDAEPISPGRFVTFSPDGKTLLRLTTPETVRGEPGSARIEWIELATAGIYRTWDLQNGISAIALSPDGRLLAGALGDSRQVLLWEVSLPASKEPQNNADLKQAVDLLATEDALTGRKAMSTLIAAGDRSVAMLAPHLKPMPHSKPSEEDIQRLIQDLDNEEFLIREKASGELQGLGSRAVPALEAELEKAPSREVTLRIQLLLKPSSAPLKPVSGESLRRIRAFEILEKIGTAQALDVLQKLAEDSESSPDRTDARLALKRIHHLKAGP